MPTINREHRLARLLPHKQKNNPTSQTDVVIFVAQSSLNKHDKKEPTRMRGWQILLASLLLISAVSARVCAQAAEPAPAQAPTQSNANVESKTSEATVPTQP